MVMQQAPPAVRAGEDVGRLHPRRRQPGGRECNDFGGSTDINRLDFPIEPGGTPRPFASDPDMLSWNPADWGTSMAPLAFGSPAYMVAPSAWSLPDGVPSAVAAGQRDFRQLQMGRRDQLRGRRRHLLLPGWAKGSPDRRRQP